MSHTGTFSGKAITLKQWCYKKWFPPVAVLLACLVTALLLVVFNEATARPGMRRSFVVMIMPFAIVCAGISAPLLYWILQKNATGYRLWLKLAGMAVLGLLLSYGTGWLYFTALLNVPVPDGLWRFILQDIFANSMPFWIALAAMSSLRRLFQATDKVMVNMPDAPEESRRQKPTSLTVSFGNSTYVIDPAEVIWAKAEGNYVKLFTNERFYLKHMSLKKLVAEAPDFIRIHRSYLINVRYFESLAPLDHGDLEIKLKSGDSVKCSRNYASALREMIGAQSQ